MQRDWPTPGCSTSHKVHIIRVRHPRLPSTIKLGLAFLDVIYFYWYHEWNIFTTEYHLSWRWTEQSRVSLANNCEDEGRGRWWRLCNLCAEEWDYRPCKGGRGIGFRTNEETSTENVHCPQVVSTCHLNEVEWTWPFIATGSTGRMRWKNKSTRDPGPGTRNPERHRFWNVYWDPKVDTQLVMGMSTRKTKATDVKLGFVKKRSHLPVEEKNQSCEVMFDKDISHLEPQLIEGPKAGPCLHEMNPQQPAATHPTASPTSEMRESWTVRALGILSTFTTSLQR